jgi:NAD(P)-dependent dehydrogenase (short-subunit alcohol dehydrogenase family)
MVASLFRGKVALVTGSASGLGRETAKAFARDGAKVVVADIDVTGGKKTVEMIKKAGGEATFIKADVTKSADVGTLIDKTVKLYGGLDCAHNNVGIEELQVPFNEGTEESWDRIINIDLKSVWLCMKYELDYMVKHGGGSIVNTSSIAGLSGTPGIPAYTAAKHGIIGLTRVAALEFGKKGIRVNTVCPAGMKGTGIYKRVEKLDPHLKERVVEIVPLGRDSEPAEIAESVIWLSSDKASYVTGCTMAVDGGFSA